MNNAELLIALTVVIVIVFVTAIYSSAMTTNTRVRENITAVEACGMIQAHQNSRDLLILDVRTPGEFADGHIQGAVNIDVNAKSFAEDVGKLPRDADYLVYCRSGNRSLTAISIMKKLGFTSMYNMRGGYREWVKTDCAGRS